MRIAKILTAATGAWMISVSIANAQSQSPWQAAADAAEAVAQRYQRVAMEAEAGDDPDLQYSSRLRFHESLRAAAQTANRTLERQNRERIERGLRELEERRRDFEAMQRLRNQPGRDPAITSLPTYPRPATPPAPFVLDPRCTGPGVLAARGRCG
jgi:hypothetical protein